MANKRIFYATKGLAVKKTGAAAGSGVLAFIASGVNASNLWEVPRGIQSVSVTTTYNLDQVFQQGQLSLYEQVEDRPDVEMTINRVLDGTMPLYLIASDESGTNEQSLSFRTSTYQADFALHIYKDTNNHASGNPESRMLCSGMYMSAITYTFPIDGPSTEELTFVGNNKFWSTADANGSASGTAPYLNFPSGFKPGTTRTTLITSDEDAAATGVPGQTKGVTRREDFDLTNSTLPTVIHVDDRKAITNVTVSTDLNREDIFVLGSRDAYTKTVNFPIEVTCSFEILTAEGDKIEAVANKDNLTNQTIIIKTKQGLVINLGTKNKLQSVDFTGGDTGGGNVSVTYTFVNFNDLTISHTGFLDR